jgi:hypothetical protein
MDFTKTLIEEYSNEVLEEKKKRKARRKSNVTYTTGSIGLNLDFFNKELDYDKINDFLNSGKPTEGNNEGTVAGEGTGEGTGETGGEAGGAMGESLTEAKRYVRRYYIRPQNIFCSNKADIIKALIDIGDQNCSVYTLNNLGDEKDVSKLMNSDIIYYYDEGILYDKNHVKVMDYDLYIKHEENRPKVANVDAIPDEKFNDMYDDRITDTTGFDESVKHHLCESKDEVCCICGEKIEGYGNNAEPYDEGRCCDACNLKFVIPARIELANNKED